MKVNELYFLKLSKQMSNNVNKLNLSKFRKNNLLSDFSSSDECVHFTDVVFKMALQVICISPIFAQFSNA